MIDRKALATALEAARASWEVNHKNALVYIAAQERLAQLPPYSPALVERLTEAMFIVPFHGEMNRDFVRRQALIALELLNGNVE